MQVREVKIELVESKTSALNQSEKSWHASLEVNDVNINRTSTTKSHDDFHSICL